MKIVTFFAVLSCVACVHLQAQTGNKEAKTYADSLQKTAALKTDAPEGWKFSGNVGLNFSQTGLSNWSGGGQNAVSIAALFVLNPHYHAKDFAWENSIEAGYGVTKLGESDFRKSDDRLIIVSRASMRASEHLRYTGLMDFRTQLTIGRNFDSVNAEGISPKTSNLFAPAFLTFSAGMEYKPADFFSVLLAPIANRTTFVLDNELAERGAFGVDPGKNIRTEIGGLFNMFFKYELIENVTIQSRLNLFTRYATPDLVVVTWENLILMKVNEYISVSLATDLLYDHRIELLRDDKTRGPATQMRNIFAAGFIYKF